MSLIGTLVDEASQLIGDIAGNYALISSPTRYIGFLFPDVVVREVHEDSWTITAHPTELGTPVSDHKFRNPMLVEIVFGYSDDGKVVGYTTQMYEAALSLGQATEPFDVSTGKRQYRNMLVTNVATVTDEQFESAGLFTMRLQEVIITATDGGTTTGTKGTQAEPQQTASTTDLGTQQVQPVSGLTSFSASGPVTETGTGIGGSGLIGGGGSLTFDSYLNGFSP